MASKLKTATLRQTVLIDAAPLDVYNAYVNPKLHTAFTNAKATGSPKVGGNMTAWDGYIAGKYLELVPGKKIVQEWTSSEWPDHCPPSTLELRFTAKGKATQITMIHSKVPAEQAKGYKSGWYDFYWNPLQEYFLSR